MSPHVLTALLATLTGAVVSTLAAAPNPELGFVIQFAGLGAVFGTAIALYRDHYSAHPDGDRRARIIAGWTMVGLLGSVVYLLITEVL